MQRNLHTAIGLILGLSLLLGVSLGEIQRQRQVIKVQKALLGKQVKSKFVRTFPSAQEALPSEDFFKSKRYYLERAERELLKVKEKIERDRLILEVEQSELRRRLEKYAKLRKRNYPASYWEE